MRTLAIILLLSLVFTLPTSAADEDLGAALVEAAQQSDTALALKLIEQGADIESANRYGATVIFFAADKGNLELVKALIAKGADVNVTDTFYGANPLLWTLFAAAESADHRAIALELLKAGATSVSRALSFAARQGDLEMARLAMASGSASFEDVQSAIETAQEAENAEVAAFLKTNAPPKPAPSEEPIDVSSEVLQTLVGEFKNEESGFTAQVFLDGETLKFRRGSTDPVTLIPLGDLRFQPQGLEGTTLSFGGRGGLIENFTAENSSDRMLFQRQLPTEEIAEAVEAAPLPEARRRAAAPWPSFRGPALSGIADGQGAPTTWNGESGANVRWRTPIPGIALSSPIVWGDRVFVTTSISSAGDETFRTGLYGDVDSVDDESEHSWKVYALDRKSGDVVWERTSTTGVPAVKRHLKSSHANPTPVTDGRHVVAFFGSEGLFCYTVDGELLWRQELGVLSSGWFYDPTYEWGFSSSPIIHDDLVITQVDIQKGSFIAAFDLRSGEERWRTPREEIPTWGTPNVLEGKGGAEIVTNGTTIRGYDAKTGKELWTLGPNSEVTVGSPIIGDGVAYVTGGYPPVRPIYAVRPGGRGDISLAEGVESSEVVAWSTKTGGTYIPTPLLYEGHLYMLHNNGRLSVHDATTGEMLYRERVGQAESFSGSPIAADGRLYFTTEEGKTYVVRSGPVYEVLEENELGEVVMTTPAVSDGMMIVRGMRNVIALGGS